VSTEKLRRQLAELKARGAGNCRGCGYPEYPVTGVKVVMHRPGEPREERPLEDCTVCGREIPRRVIQWMRAS